MDSSFIHRYLWGKQGQIFVGIKRISVNFVVLFWRSQIFCLFLHSVKIHNMNTTTFQITVPTTDVSMLKKLIAGMGWTMSALTPRKKAGIERGLEDIKKGNVYHAENSADLIKQIFG